MLEAAQKFSTYHAETLEEAIFLLIAYVLTIAINIGIAYIIYRIIKRLIRYGIDYYFYRKELFETNRELDDLNIEMFKKESRFNRKKEEKTKSPEA